jgi:hypothetical protein
MGIDYQNGGMVRRCWYIRWLVLFTQNGDDIWNFLLICYIYLECAYYTAPRIYAKRKESLSNFLVMLQ